MTDMPERIWVELTPIKLGSSDGPFWTVKSGIADIHWEGATEYVRADLTISTEPTEAQITSACMSYSHDFGLMDGPERVALMHEARAWLQAWRKEFPGEVQPKVNADRLNQVLRDLITEQSEGEWGDALIEKDVKAFSARILAALVQS